MKGNLPGLQIFGADRRQFRLSVAVALIGFIVMQLVVPPGVRESETPPFIVETHNAARIAGNFVIAIIALLCAVNAYRDKNNVAGERIIILGWCIALCLWLLISVSSLLNWWGLLKPDIRPTWLQGI